MLLYGHITTFDVLYSYTFFAFEIQLKKLGY